MNSQDFLNYTAGITLWVLMGLSVYLGINLVQIFKKLQRTTRIALKTALEIQLLKSTMKKGVVGFMENVMNLFLEGGVSRGRK